MKSITIKLWLVDLMELLSFTRSNPVMLIDDSVVKVSGFQQAV